MRYRAPLICETCSGAGWVWIDRKQERCPQCKGELLIWPVRSEELRRRIREVRARRRGGIKKGFHYKLWTCDQCGAEVAMNSAVRHLKRCERKAS